MSCSSRAGCAGGYHWLGTQYRDEEEVLMKKSTSHKCPCTLPPGHPPVSHLCLVWA